MNNCSAIVLAAGKGTRMKADKINKVMYPLAGKPMIGYTIDLLEKVGFKEIVVVVGFKRDAIMGFLNSRCKYAVQKRVLGTAHAAKTGLMKVSGKVKNALVMNADDSAFYPAEVIKRMMKKHKKEKNGLTFLTVDLEKPSIARVIRDKKGKVLGVVEQKNLKPEEKKFKEINCGCYCFSVEFLNKYLPKVKKNPLAKEYYITELIELGIENGEKVKAFKMGKEDYWHSVNTKEQLQDAEKRMQEKMRQ